MRRWKLPDDNERARFHSPTPLSEQIPFGSNLDPTCSDLDREAGGPPHHHASGNVPLSRSDPRREKRNGYHATDDLGSASRQVRMISRGINITGIWSPEKNFFSGASFGPRYELTFPP